MIFSPDYSPSSQVGAVVRWWDNKEGKVIVGPLPDTPGMQHQVRREALGGVLCFEAASRVICLEGGYRHHA